MENYIDSEQHWEDSVNADHDRKELEDKAFEPLTLAWYISNIPV